VSGFEHKEFSMKRVALLLLPLAALALQATSFAGQAEMDWDQARVAALARDLLEPLETLRVDLQSRPPVPEKAKAYAAVLNDVERLAARAKELSERLASGAGRAETVALFREVEALRDQAAKHSQEYPAPFDMHLRIEQIDATTRQLARYYGG
jgi:hypothetical protein